MITKFYANGFKSLSDFSISFNDGLNVLIGPNGSGKTTICQAMGILSAIANGKIEEYLLSIGGTSSIFNISEDNTDISLSCRGYIDSVDKKDDLISVRYDYKVKFSIKDRFRFNEERLTVSVFNRKTKRYNKTFTTELIDRKHKLFIFNEDLMSFHRFGDTHRKTYTLELGSSNSSVISTSSLFTFIGYRVEDDLRSISMYNIDPNVAKQSSDILDSSRMDSNGKNLANNIFHFSIKDKDKLNELNLFLQKICARYEKVVPAVLRSGGRMRTFSIRDINGSKCIASSLSDGTIKAIALFVATLNSLQGNAIIEEPENYIHPWGCRLIIDHIRETYVDSVCVLTTHSETILNSIHPSEIIVCENSNGHTAASRIQDSDVIEDVIRASGFGCGYHYVTGALGGTPSC